MWCVHSACVHIYNFTARCIDYIESCDPLSSTFYIKYHVIDTALPTLLRQRNIFRLHALSLQAGRGPLTAHTACSFAERSPSAAKSGGTEPMGGADGH